MQIDHFAQHIAYLKEGLGKSQISERLFQRFKDLIVQGKLPAGYTLPNENIISEQLGVGRSTLREAYTALAVFGFITRSKAGTYINEMDNMVLIAPFSITVENSDLADLLEFRYMLEAEMASYAAKRATQQDIQQLTQCYESMIQVKEDVNLFCNYDSEFHMLVAIATHNKLLMNTMLASKESFEKGIRLAMRESLTQNPRAFDVTIELHGKILEAIKNGDYQTAYAVMREHISYVNLTVKYG